MILNRSSSFLIQNCQSPTKINRKSTLTRYMLMSIDQNNRDLKTIAPQRAPILPDDRALRGREEPAKFSSFLTQNSSFLIKASSFLIRNSSFISLSRALAHCGEDDRPDIDAIDIPRLTSNCKINGHSSIQNHGAIPHSFCIFNRKIENIWHSYCNV